MNIYVEDNSKNMQDESFLKNYRNDVYVKIDNNFYNLSIITINRLKDEIRLEQTAKLDYEVNTCLDIRLISELCSKYIKTSINNIPTKYLCNSAYYHALKKNKNTLFVHIPGFSKITNMNLMVDIIKGLKDEKFVKTEEENNL